MNAEREEMEGKEEEAIRSVNERKRLMKRESKRDGKKS